jgi:carboxypeptidase C (cathepsin A)
LTLTLCRRAFLAPLAAAALLLVALPAPARESLPDHPIAQLQLAEAHGTEAKSDGDAKSSEAKRQDAASPLPPAAISEHSITIAGEKIDYTTEAGTVALPAKAGRPDAEIFYVAYRRKPESAKRPITFVFNGGPGAASTYLHLGALGPRAIAANSIGRLEGPPPRLVDNDATWLDLTDLVFVDPVGTGYSHVGDGEDKYWGVEQDRDALADFVRLYLTKSARMLSPVFLVGESYGGFRVAALARALQKSGANSPSGVVLVSPVLEFSLLYADDFNPLSWAIDLPSLAAVNLEKKGVTGREALCEALRDTEHYALTDYLVALASGVDEGGEAASKKVAELTGLPLPLVEKNDARVSASLFIKEFDRANKQVLSRYDGSIAAPDPHPASAHATGPDPVLDATVPLWTAAFVEYAGEELGYKTDRPYRLLNREVRNKWDFGTSPTRQGYAGVVEDLQDARAANPSLSVLIATGYTDLITPYLASTYLVSQLPTLPNAAPIRVETYAGGHMLYLRPESRVALKEDVKGMYDRAAKAASLPEG